MLDNFMGVIGAVVLLTIAFLFSTNRRAINLRIVGSAFLLQIIIAVFVLFSSIGKSVIENISGGVQTLLGYSSEGIGFLFGPLAGNSLGLVFAFQILPIVIFFSSLMAVLYHLRIMPVVVAGIGGFLQMVLGTRPIESLNAAANIFVGQTEAPLAIKPYLDKISGPQLFAIMVSGFASVAGSILAALALAGVDLKFLLAASIMAAPGGLLMAKIIMPDDSDDDEQVADLKEIANIESPYENVFMAAAVGASDGMRLAINIAAMLIAFISLIALVNGIFGAAGNGICSLTESAGLGCAGFFQDLSIQKILGLIFAPLMFILGVPQADIQTAGALFGEKFVLNEFVAYLSLIGEAESMQPKSVAIITFALCGFANLASIGIMLGGLGALIPDRLGEIASLGMRALLAASLSNLMSAALAGIMLSL